MFKVSCENEVCEQLNYLLMFVLHYDNIKLSRYLGRLSMKTLGAPNPMPSHTDDIAEVDDFLTNSTNGVKREESESESESESDKTTIQGRL